MHSNCYFKPSGALAEMILENVVDAMVVNALAPCHATMVLNV